MSGRQSDARARATTGTRGTSRPRAGRDPLVAAAVDNFRRRGYHGTSMRDIATDADVTVASIYHHFASKQVLLQQIMERVLTDAISVTRRALIRAGESPTDQLAEVMRAWVAFHATRQAEAMIGASEIRSLDDDTRPLIVALRDEQENLFRDVIERGVETGEFRTAHPHEATWAIITMGNTVAGFFQPAGQLTAAQLADIYADLALGTVRADRMAHPDDRTDKE